MKPVSIFQVEVLTKGLVRLKKGISSKNIKKGQIYVYNAKLPHK